eukprot:1438762-Rhodomonas_salina.2
MSFNTVCTLYKAHLDSIGQQGPKVETPSKERNERYEQEQYPGSPPYASLVPDTVYHHTLPQYRTPCTTMLELRTGHRVGPS